MNVLFVCSKNQWRSPTAEKIYAQHASLQVRSRGTATSARQTIGTVDLQWADVIFVMESKHKQRIRAEFSDVIDNKPIHVLDIPDEYQFMDPELVDLLQISIDAFLDSPES